MHASKTILRGCFTSVLSAWTRSKGVTLSLSLSSPEHHPSFLLLPCLYFLSPDPGRASRRADAQPGGPGWNVKRGIVCEILIPLRPHPLDVTEKYEPSARLSLSLSLSFNRGITVMQGSWIIAFVISSLGLWRKKGGDTSFEYRDGCWIFFNFTRFWMKWKWLV